MRIALTGYRGNPHVGGQGVYIRNLSREIAKLGVAVDVIAGPPYPKVEEGVRLVTLPSLDLYAKRFPFLELRKLRNRIDLSEWTDHHTGKFGEINSFGKRLEQYLEANPAYDLIHDNQSLSLAFIDIKERWPTISSAHHPFRRDLEQALRGTSAWWRRPSVKRWYSFIPETERVLRALDCITTPSHSAKQDMVETVGVSSDAICVVPPGTDDRVFRPDPSVRINKNLVLTTSSSDHPMKGQRYLFAALASLAKSLPDIELHITGPVRSNSGLVKLAHKLGISDRITYCGLLDEDELAAKYRSAGVVVVPSLYEGFGLPVIEGMACGAAVVTTTASSLPEAAGDAGVLVEPANAEALADAIARVLTDDKLSNKLRTKGVEHVRRNFTWPVSAQRYVELYEEQTSAFCKP